MIKILRKRDNFNLRSTITAITTTEISRSAITADAPPITALTVSLIPICSYKVIREKLVTPFQSSLPTLSRSVVCV